MLFGKRWNEKPIIHCIIHSYTESESVSESPKLATGEAGAEICATRGVATADDVNTVRKRNSLPVVEMNLCQSKVVKKL